ncbi:unnamed protein product [Brassica oleracea var. botrytis]
MPSRYPGAVTQDWEPVVLHKTKPKSQDLRDPKAVNAALRSGLAVQTVKKFDAGSNKKGKSMAVPVINTKKLEEETEPSAMDRVKAEVRLAIQKARLEKKMSQADLAKQINERTQVVQEYENGKAVPNQAVLAKMEKVLGVKLRAYPQAGEKLNAAARTNPNPHVTLLVALDCARQSFHVAHVQSNSERQFPLIRTQSLFLQRCQIEKKFFILV